MNKPSPLPDRPCNYRS